MKNKGLIVLIISVVIVVVISIIYIYNIKVIDGNILNTKWYHYDYKTGYYEIFYLDDYALTIYNPSNNNITNEYSFCKNYKYNRIKNEITLDCGKRISIKNVDKDYIKLDIDSKEIVFYKNLNNSINYEFKVYFGMSISEYKKKNMQALEIIKIDKNEINNIAKEKEYSKIIFIGDKCSDVSCVLINDVIEKWISFSKDIYYIDSTDVDEDFVEKNSILSIIPNDYNDLYPTVLVVSDNNAIDTYKINCIGFNCAKYYNK